MVWQSWGHSDSTPHRVSSTSAGSLRDSYLGRRFLDWMDHHVRGDESASQGPAFAYFRDWVRYDTSPAAAGTAVERRPPSGSGSARRRRRRCSSPATTR